MRSKLILSAAIASITAASVSATAQEGTSIGGLEEIIVTAQRVATSLQDTPISMQTYSDDELRRLGVSDLQALALSDSSVNISLSTAQPIISIRGVASQDATEVGDPAVSVATDGIFTNRPSGTFGGLYDIERVEILRGPQGTLFGRNSTGGTINVITARATDTNEARITTEIGNYDLFASEGFVNFTLTDTLYARASFDVRSREGFRDNAPSIQNGDDEDLKSGRLQLAYEPSDSFNAWVLGQYTRLGGVGTVTELHPFEYEGESGGEPLHTNPDALSDDGMSFPAYARGIRDLKQWDLRGGFTYTFDSGVSLNYLAGYSAIRYLRQQNINPYAFGPDPIAFAYNNRETPDTINQEIRLASDPGERFTWQAGLYYFKEDSSVVARTIIEPTSSSEALGVEFLYPDITSESKAIFAQVGYNLTDALKLTAGARYTKDEKERDGTFAVYAGQPEPVVVFAQPAKTDSSEPTWTLGLDYAVSDDSMIYGKVSTGYKVGGFNNADSDYDPETLIAYELGSKNTFLDNHLQVNVAVYRMDYEDQQVTQFVAGEQSTGSITVNAGESEITGLELDIIAQSDSLGRLTLSGNYTDAEYKEFDASAGWDSSLNLDLSGNNLPLSSEFTFTARYEYPFALSNGATITPNISAKYQDEFYFGANNYDTQKQDAYTSVDAGIVFAPADGKWELQAYVKNMTDETIFADANEFYTFNNYTYTYQPPRTYGLRLTAFFE